MRRAIWLVVSLALLTAPVAWAQERPVTIRYFGWSFFLVTTADGLRIAHLGDIGQPALTDGQLRALGTIDILMIPVGDGPFTVTVPQANNLVAQIQPKIVIPIHYKTPVRQPPTWPGLDERPFLEGKSNVRRQGHTLVVAKDRRHGSPAAVRRSGSSGER